jgi:hypothetical protein
MEHRSHSRFSPESHHLSQTKHAARNLIVSGAGELRIAATAGLWVGKAPAWTL